MLFTLSNPFPFPVKIVGNITNWNELLLDKPITLDLIPRKDISSQYKNGYEFYYICVKTCRHIIDTNIPVIKLTDGTLHNNIIIEPDGSDFNSKWLTSAFDIGFIDVFGAYYDMIGDKENAKIHYAINIKKMDCVESYYKLGKIYKKEGNLTIAKKLFKNAADGGHVLANSEFKQLNIIIDKREALQYLKLLGDDKICEIK